MLPQLTFEAKREFHAYLEVVDRLQSTIQPSKDKLSFKDLLECERKLLDKIRNVSLFFQRSGHHLQEEESLKYFQATACQDRKRALQCATLGRAVKAARKDESKTLFHLHKMVHANDRDFTEMLLTFNPYHKDDVNWPIMAQHYNVSLSPHLQHMVESAVQGNDKEITETLKTYCGSMRPRNLAKGEDGKTVRPCLSKHDYVYLCYHIICRRVKHIETSPLGHASDDNGLIRLYVEVENTFVGTVKNAMENANVKKVGSDLRLLVERIHMESCGFVLSDSVEDKGEVMMEDMSDTYSSYGTPVGGFSQPFTLDSQDSLLVTIEQSEYTKSMDVSSITSVSKDSTKVASKETCKSMDVSSSTSVAKDSTKVASEETSKSMDVSSSTSVAKDSTKVASEETSKSMDVSSSTSVAKDSTEVASEETSKSMDVSSSTSVAKDSTEVASEETSKSMDVSSSTSVAKDSTEVASEETSKSMDVSSSTSVAKDSTKVASEETSKSMDVSSSTSVAKDSTKVASEETSKSMDVSSSTSVAKDSTEVASEETSKSMDVSSSTSVAKDSTEVASEETSKSMDVSSSTSVAKDSTKVASEETSKSMDVSSSKSVAKECSDKATGSVARRNNSIFDYFQVDSDTQPAVLFEDVAANYKKKDKKETVPRKKNEAGIIKTKQRFKTKEGIYTTRVLEGIPKAEKIIPKSYCPSGERLREVFDSFGLQRSEEGSTGYLFTTDYGSFKFFYVLASALVDINHPMIIPTPLTFEDEFRKDLAKGATDNDKSTYSFDPLLYSVKPLATAEISPKPYDLDTLLHWAAKFCAIEINVYVEGEEDVITYTHHPNKKPVHIIIVAADNQQPYFLRLRQIDKTTTTKAINVEEEIMSTDGLSSQQQMHPGLVMHEYNCFFDNSQDNELTKFLNDFEPELKFEDFVKQPYLEGHAEALYDRITEVLCDKRDSQVVAIKAAYHDRRGGHMRYSDLYTLISEEWLTNHTMDYYLNTLRERFRSKNKKICVFHCDFFETLFKKRSANLSTSLHGHYSHFNVYNYARFNCMPYRFEYCDLLICLVNEPNSHWMVIIADFTKKVKTVTLYDSLGEKQKKKTKKSPRDTIRDAYLDAFCNYMDDEIRKNTSCRITMEKGHIHTPEICSDG